MTSLFTVKVALFLFSAVFIIIAFLYCIILIEDTKELAKKTEDDKLGKQLIKYQEDRKKDRT